MTKLTRAVLRHRRWVVAIWALLAFAGAAMAGTTAGRLSTNFSLPNTESETSAGILQSVYGNGGNENALVAVVRLPAGTTADSPDVRSQLAAAFDAMQRADPSARIVSYASTGSRMFVSKDGHITYGLIFTRFNGGTTPPPENATIKRAAAGTAVAGAPVQFTGYEDLQSSNGQNSGTGPSVLLETLIGGTGALLVLIFVFASFMALVPLVIAACSILTTFLCILVLTSFLDVSFIIEFLVGLIGLGVAIDYSLLIVVRWREERARGLDNVAAVERAMSTAGRAIVFSGTTVAIGLLALIVIPVPFLRSIGFGGVLIPLVSVLVATTLLPVILASIGPRVDWPRIRHEGVESRGWSRWARGIVRNRWLAAGGALALVGALVAATFTIVVGTPQATTLSASGQAHDALATLIDSGIGPGPLETYEVIAPTGEAAHAAEMLSRLPGILGAVAPPADQHWSREGTALAVAVPAFDLSSSAGSELNTRVVDAVHGLPGVHVSGPGVFNSDFVKQVYGSFPLMIAIIAVLTFVLLARAFRSIVLPLKAVVLNILSVAAAYGILVLVWQDGHGSSLLWGISATHAITFWVPVMVFAFLFGLSMDYEVFILARMREEYDASRNTNQAVVHGIARTGRLVTCAALILFFAFVSMSTAPVTDVKILATGLAAGILLDATVVRALLVPALVSLFGRWNWVLPDGVARLLRVAPSHPFTPAEAAAEA